MPAGCLPPLRPHRAGDSPPKTGESEVRRERSRNKASRLRMACGPRRTGRVGDIRRDWSTSTGRASGTPSTLDANIGTVVEKTESSRCTGRVGDIPLDWFTNTGKASGTPSTLDANIGTVVEKTESSRCTGRVGDTPLDWFTSTGKASGTLRTLDANIGTVVEKTESSRCTGRVGDTPLDWFTSTGKASGTLRTLDANIGTVVEKTESSRCTGRAGDIPLDWFTSTGRASGTLRTLDANIGTVVEKTESSRCTGRAGDTPLDWFTSTGRASGTLRTCEANIGAVFGRGGRLALGWRGWLITCWIVFGWLAIAAASGGVALQDASTLEHNSDLTGNLRADAPTAFAAGERRSFRIVWGGDEPRTWNGRIQIRGGRFARFTPLGMLPDSAAISDSPQEIRIRSLLAGQFNGCDLEIEGDAQATLLLQLTARRGRAGIGNVKSLCRNCGTTSRNNSRSTTSEVGWRSPARPGTA